MVKTHTPGPWRRRKTGRGNVVWQALGREILTHSQEDASLIAAAPDLFAAAKAALEPGNIEYGLELLAVAIAKAEGRP